MVRRLLAVLTLGSFALSSPACTSSAPAKKSASDNAATDSDDGDSDSSDTTSGGTTTGGTTGCTTTDTSTDDGTTLALAESDYDDVKSIIDAKCVSCHKAGGTGTGDYTTYAGASAAAQEILDRTKSTTMPMPPAGSPTLTSDELSKLATWVAAETGGGTGTTTGCGTTTGDTSTTTTGTGTTTGGTDGDFFNDILTPTKRAECNSQNLVYNWGTKVCDKATMPAAFACTHAGILAAAHNDANIQTKLNEYDAAHWTYDQCGSDAGKIVVFFTCPTTDGTTCLTVDQVKANPNVPSLTVKFGCFGRTTDTAGTHCAL